MRQRRTLEESDPEKFKRRYGYYPNGYVSNPPTTSTTLADSSRVSESEVGKPTPRDFIFVNEEKMVLAEVGGLSYDVIKMQ